MGEEMRVRNPFVVKFREGNETGINVLCVELHKLCVSRDRRLAELVFEVAASEDENSLDDHRCGGTIVVSRSGEARLEGWRGKKNLSFDVLLEF